MTEEQEMFRINTRISVEANNWLDAKSKKTGISKSAFINIAVEHYILQNRQVDALELSQGTLKELFAKVQQIQDQLTSSDSSSHQKPKV